MTCCNAAVAAGSLRSPSTRTAVWRCHLFGCDSRVMSSDVDFTARLVSVSSGASLPRKRYMRPVVVSIWF